MDFLSKYIDIGKRDGENVNQSSSHANVLGQICEYRATWTPLSFSNKKVWHQSLIFLSIFKEIYL